MQSITVDSQLDGWHLAWARLVLDGPAADLASLRHAVAERARQRFGTRVPSDHPVIAAVRALFRAAGCDPTRYRPSSEALLRRLLKGQELPAIHPFVDLNNALSVDLLVPACVLADGTFSPPLVFRRGEAGETYESLRGPFNLEGKPLLADAAGPFGTPITDSERVKVGPETRTAWLVAYLPAAALLPSAADTTLDTLLEQAPGIHRGDGSPSVEAPPS